tara:strand:- start:172 stop:657 length:486 start_codon:yes stop_codon:yes gene_type:complete
MALPHNPAGSSTPAGNTMSYPRGQSGGRTRNVVNISQPGSEGTATFSWTGGDGADAAPSAATDGFPNFRRQRYLHVLCKNNASGGNFKFKIWLYNSSFGQWGALALTDAQTPAGVVVESTVANNIDLYYIYDIAGAERIYIQATTLDSGGTVQAFCGVNSF